MEVVKRFNNRIGYAEIRKYGDKLVEVLHSTIAEVSHFMEFDYKAEAVQQFQFDSYWLDKTDKTCFKEES